MARPSSTVSILFGLSLAIATVSADAAPDAISTKYFTRDGNSVHCMPAGALKELVESKYKCYAAGGAEACSATFDAARGVLDARFLELFGDLVQTDEQGRFRYMLDCKGLGPGEYAHFLAVGGIGYARANAHLDSLIGLTRPAVFEKASGQLREDIVTAIARFGVSPKAKVTPAFARILSTEGRLLAFKKVALAHLARLGSDDGVAYCTEVLVKGVDKDMTKTCAWYAGERKVAALAPALIKRYEEQTVVFGRALGMIGSKEAIPVLKETYEKFLGSSIALPATVALLNLGDKSHDYAGDLASMIAGRRPLSMADRSRKAEDLKAKKKGADKRWKDREDQTDENVAREAALESTYAVNAAAAKAIDDALAKTAAKTDWPRASTFATSALAQRGSKTAIAALVAALKSPKKEVRQIAIDALGARADSPDTFAEFVGRRGIAADATVPPALLAAIDTESDENTRRDLLRAAGAARGQF
jgi:HEAT repeat protein